MRAGSVIIDLAASSGGNCAVTENDQVINHNGVIVVGDSNLPKSIPSDASKMFSKNVFNLLKIMIEEGNLKLDFEDDIIKGTTVTHNKEIISDRIKEQMAPSA